jgi:hypothetical protein
MAISPPGLGPADRAADQGRVARARGQGAVHRADLRPCTLSTICAVDKPQPTSSLFGKRLHSRGVTARRQAGAAYHQLLEAGTITADQVTVVVLTSTGVKATPQMADLMGVKL